MKKPKDSKEVIALKARVKELENGYDRKSYRVAELEGRLEKREAELKDHIAYHARYMQLESENGYLRDLVAGLTKTRHTKDELVSFRKEQYPFGTL
jgi:hypothetical protein